MRYIENRIRQLFTKERQKANPLVRKVDERTGILPEHLPVMRREQQGWEITTGAEIDIKKLPKFLNHEVVEGLRQSGYPYIGYTPALDTQKLKEDDIKDLKNEAKIYPNLTPLAHYGYWSKVDRGQVERPILPGEWVGIGERRYLFKSKATWRDSMLDSQEQGQKTIDELGLPVGVVTPRLLEPHELQLWSQRMGWNVIREWTNTKVTLQDEPLVSGDYYFDARGVHDIVKTPLPERIPDFRLVSDRSNSIGRLVFVTRVTDKSYPDIAYRPVLVLGAGE